MFFEEEITRQNIKYYILGIFVFLAIVLILLVCELLLPKSFNKNIELINNENYVFEIEDISNSRVKISISGYAFIKSFNSVLLVPLYTYTGGGLLNHTSVWPSFHALEQVSLLKLS